MPRLSNEDVVAQFKEVLQAGLLPLQQQVKTLVEENAAQKAEIARLRTDTTNTLLAIDTSNDEQTALRKEHLDEVKKINSALEDVKTAQAAPAPEAEAVKPKKVKKPNQATINGFVRYMLTA